MAPTLLEHTEALKDVILDHLNHDICIECKTCGNMILWSYETWKEISMEE